MLLPLTALGLALCARPTHAEPPPAPTVFVDVRLVDDADAPRVAIVVEDGRVRAILGPDEPVPATHRRIEGQGLLALPAFVDAYAHAGAAAPDAVPDPDDPPTAASDALVAMRAANRKGLRPALRAVDVFALDDAALGSWRASGFGALHAAPEGHLLGGWTTVVTCRPGALRERVLLPLGFQSASLVARGEGYPRTLMGRVAQLRQLFLDAGRHAELLDRAARGAADPRPPYDPELEAVQPLLRGEARLICLAHAAADIERWLALADEFGLPLAFAGGGEAWRVAEQLAAREVPVVLTLDWEEEVADPDAEPARRPPADEGARAPQDAPPSEAPAVSGGSYVEPLGVRRERRREWVEARDCALRLHEAGVRFAFGTGDGEPGALLERVRALVAAGLPREVAFAGLTRSAAELCGLADRIGALAVGADATFALWTAHPLQDDARVAWLVVDGRAGELEHGEEEPAAGAPAEGVDAAGAWAIEFESEAARPARLTLQMRPAGGLRGRFETTSPVDGAPLAGDVEGRVRGRRVELRGELDISGFSARVELEGRIEGGVMEGEITWTSSAGADRSRFRAERAPGGGEGDR